MKTRGQIAQKFKQAQYRHLKREIERLLKRTAPNCKNNRTLSLKIGPVGVCSLDCDVCDARFEDRAPECEDWDPRHEKDAIKASLKEFFQTRKVPEIAIRFPDVAALLWVLADDEEDPQAGPLIPQGVSVTLSGVQVWVDSEEEVRQVSQAVVDLAQKYAAEREPGDAAAEKDKEIEHLLSRVRVLEDEVVTALPEKTTWWRRWLPWG